MTTKKELVRYFNHGVQLGQMLLDPEQTHTAILYLQQHEQVTCVQHLRSEVVAEYEDDAPLGWFDRMLGVKKGPPVRISRTRTMSWCREANGAWLAPVDDVTLGSVFEAKA